MIIPDETHPVPGVSKHCGVWFCWQETYQLVIWQYLICLQTYIAHLIAEVQTVFGQMGLTWLLLLVRTNNGQSRRRHSDFKKRLLSSFPTWA